jgi:DNA-binding transcriptional ArsR family regulator
MLDVTVIEDPEAAAVSLDPVRARLLAELAAEPASAAMLAGKVGLPRQKVNYHLKALERHGLVELVEERRKGNVNERLMRATATSYVISPAALGAVQPDPARSPDQLSARWLLGRRPRRLRGGTRERRNRARLQVPLRERPRPPRGRRRPPEHHLPRRPAGARRGEAVR